MRLPIVGSDSNTWGTVLNEYLRGLCLNVQDYGAEGNGSTDDTTAIQGAIDAAATAGAAVFFPAGVYITQPLSLPPGCVLEGVSGQGYVSPEFGVYPNADAVSTLKLKAGSTGPLLSEDDGGTYEATHVRIRDLALDCNGLTQPAINIADESSGVARFWIMERLYVTNIGGATGYAVYIGNNNTACVMRDCVVFNFFSSARHGNHGVGWYGQDGMMDNCYIGGFSGNGLEVLGGSSDQTFMMVGGGIFTCTTGVVVAGKGPTFMGVSIDHNYEQGVYVGYGPCAFIGCTFHTNSRTTTNQWSDILVNATNVPIAIIGCRHGNRGGETSNVAKYFVDCAQTGIVLNAFGNINEGGDLGTGFINYSGVTSAPSFPANDTYVTNTTGADIQAFVANGTSAITEITLGTTATGIDIAANGWGVIRVPSGQRIKFAYAGGSPSWTWVIG